MPVLDPLRGRTRTGRLWAYSRDDRAYGSKVPPAVVLHYAPDRTGSRLAEHLKTVRSILQVDGYAKFEALADKGAVILRVTGEAARLNGVEPSTWRRDSLTMMVNGHLASFLDAPLP